MSTMHQVRMRRSLLLAGVLPVKKETAIQISSASRSLYATTHATGVEATALAVRSLRGGAALTPGSNRAVAGTQYRVNVSPSSPVPMVVRATRLWLNLSPLEPPTL